MLRSKRIQLLQEVSGWDDLINIILGMKIPGCDFVGVRLDLFHVLNNRIEVVRKWPRESELSSIVDLSPIFCSLNVAAEEQAAQTFVYPCPCGNTDPKRGVTGMCIWVRPMGSMLGCLHIYISPWPKRSGNALKKWEKIAPYIASAARRILLQHWVDNLPQIMRQERENAVESERRQIARSLHDTVAHELAYMLLKVGELTEYVSTNQDPVVDQGLNNLYRLVSQSNDQIRSFLSNLFRQEEYHLISRIREAANTSAKRGNFNWELQVEGEEVKLPDGEQRLILIFMQEALHNIEKHSRASLARIHLCWSEELFAIRISDNGVGFDSQQILRSDENQNGRYGLRILQECAAELEAHYQIHSDIGAGTVIVLEIPLSEYSYLPIRGESQNLPKVRPLPFIRENGSKPS